MSFEKMKRDDLYALATDNFAVDVDERATKPQIIAALLEGGVTWDMAKVYDKNAQALAEQEAEALAAANVITAASTNGTAPVVPVAVVEVPALPVEPAKVLLRMERENPRFDIRGHKFTRENPFALVGEADADYILSNVEGFKMASPREAKEFYG